MSTNGVVPTSKNPVKKLSHRHKRVLDFMVRNPEMKMQEIADGVKMTLPWISTIVNSDLFQAEFNKRREAFERHDNRAISAKLDMIAHEGLDQLMDHITLSVDVEDYDELDGPSFQEVKQVTELALKASGYLNGASRSATVVNVDNTTVVATQVSPSTLETARARIINGTSGNISEALPAEAIQASQKP